MKRKFLMIFILFFTIISFFLTNDYNNYIKLDNNEPSFIKQITSEKYIITTYDFNETFLDECFKIKENLKDEDIYIVYTSERKQAELVLENTLDSDFVYEIEEGDYKTKAICLTIIKNKVYPIIFNFLGGYSKQNIENYIIERVKNKKLLDTYDNGFSLLSDNINSDPDDNFNYGSKWETSLDWYQEEYVLYANYITDSYKENWYDRERKYTYTYDLWHTISIKYKYIYMKEGSATFHAQLTAVEVDPNYKTDTNYGLENFTYKCSANLSLEPYINLFDYEPKSVLVGNENNTDLTLLNSSNSFDEYMKIIIHVKPDSAYGKSPIYLSFLTIFHDSYNLQNIHISRRFDATFSDSRYSQNVKTFVDYSSASLDVSLLNDPHTHNYNRNETFYSPSYHKVYCYCCSATI